jgi:hypothetical protein
MAHTDMKKGMQGLAPIVQQALKRDPFAGDPKGGEAKYECVYLHAFETGSELRVGLTRWIGYHNADRPRSGLAGQTPNEVYVVNEIPPRAGLAPPSETLQLAA